MSSSAGRGKMALQHDLFRYRGTSEAKGTLRYFLRTRTFRPVATLRWYQGASGIKRRIYRQMHTIACQLAGVDISENTSIGEGFLMLHGWGIVINARAVIGRNVTVLQGVTIGRGDKISHEGLREDGYPVIEDGVTIGPNACVVGGITVGRGSRILPNAVVYFDVPPASLVGGNPAKIIKSDVPEDTWNKVIF